MSVIYIEFNKHEMTEEEPSNKKQKTKDDTHELDAEGTFLLNVDSINETPQRDSTDSSVAVPSTSTQCDTKQLKKYSVFDNYVCISDFSLF